MHKKNILTGSASKVFSVRAPSTLILRWTLLSVCGTPSGGVSLSSSVER